MGRRPQPFTLATAGVVAGALLLRLWGIREGLPYAYNVDENAHFVPKAVGFFGHSLNPHYFVNPPGYTYILRAVFGLWFGSGAAVQRAYALHPSEVFTVARVVSAVLGAIAVWLVCLTGRRLFDARTGLLAGGLLAVSFLAVFYGHQAVNDEPALAPIALSLYGLAGIVRYGRRRDYLIAGVAAGLAAATKYTGGVVVVAIAGAALVRAVDARRDAKRRGRETALATAPATTTAPGKRASKPASAWGPLGALALAGVCALVAFLAANPYALADLSQFGTDVVGQGAVAGTDKLGDPFSNGYLFYVWTAGWGLGVVPAVAAIGGAALLIWRERRLAWVLVPAPIAFFIFMGQQQRYFGRWLLPIFPILCLLAAVGAVGAIRALARRRPALAPALAAIALLAQGLVYAVHNDRVLSRPDTRALARAWMVAHLPPGTPMLVEPVAPGAWLSDPGRSFAQTPDGSRWTYVNPLDGPTSSGAIGVAALSAIGGGGLARTLDAGAPGGTTADAASRPAAELLAAVGADPLDDQVGDSTFPYLYTSDLQAVGNESYVRSVSPELINLLEARGVCIIVTGSTVWGRAFNAPKQVPLAVAYYRDLATHAQVLFRATPSADPQSFNFDWSFDYYPLAYTRPGPEVVVYRLHGGRCAP